MVVRIVAQLRMVWLAALPMVMAASMALSACGEDDEVEPALPDLSWLVEAYEHPTAELDVTGAWQQLTEALPVLRSVRALENVKFVLESLGDVSSGLVVRGLDQELRADIDGHANVRVICPGDQPDLEPDAQRDGTLVLHIEIRDAMIEPVVTGEAVRCRIHELPEGTLPAWFPDADLRFDAQLDGPIAIHTGAPLVLGRETTLRPIVRVDGTLRVDELPPLQGFDFRVSARDRLEIRIPIAQEHVILVLAQDGVAIRERRGEWVCEPELEDACTPSF